MEFAQNPPVKVWLLPGGILPKRQTEGAVGYDAYARAIVHNSEMDPDVPVLRKTLFDLKNRPPQWGHNQIEERDDELCYRLEPGEDILVGIGFAMEMPHGLVQIVAPRSGLATKQKVSLMNAPGTVDPDYRGEAGVLMLNRGDKPFYLKYGMRIAQLVFHWAVFPEMHRVERHDELSSTKRGSEGFGSTGVELEESARASLEPRRAQKHT